MQMTDALFKATHKLCGIAYNHADMIDQYNLGMITEAEFNEYLRSDYYDRADEAFNDVSRACLPLTWSDTPIERVFDDAVEEIIGRIGGKPNSRNAAHIFHAAHTLTIAFKLPD